MPQLDPSSFISQLFWLALTFIPLYLIMARVGLPRVADIREQRAVRIANDLEQAEDLKNKADKLKAEFETALANARTQAQETLAQNREKIQAEADARQEEVAKKIAADLEKAEAAIQASKTEALANIRTVTADICKDMVSRVAGIDLDVAKAQAAVDEKMSHMTNQGAA